MRRLIDEACDPQARSWVVTAHDHADFPLQNLPLGVVRERGQDARWRVGTAIGESVLDLAACAEAQLLPSTTDAVRHVLHQSTLAPLLALGHEAVGALRLDAHRLLRDDAAAATQDRTRRCLIDGTRLENALPVVPGQFTDFFASLHHISRVVRLRDAAAPLPPATPYVPLAYHSAVSSIRVSDGMVVRPRGAIRTASAASFAVTERLDYEAELGLVVGRTSTVGTPVALDVADDYIAGVCLLNDWSARDIQAFESQPLGPFAGKSFATTLSPWLVTTHALAPFVIDAAARPAPLPPPLPHLIAEGQRAVTWAIEVEAWLSSAMMRKWDLAPVKLSTANLRDLLWTPAQLLAQLTSNGYGVRVGDLVGTGTVSGPEADGRATLLELTRGGLDRISLPTGERRGYLEDGDEVTLRASCRAPHAVPIGFGACRGRIVPAPLRGPGPIIPLA